MKKIKESPDRIKTKDINVDFEDGFAFGYYKNKFYLTSQPHSWLGGMYKELPHELTRNDLKYAGRVWFMQNVISFWEFPEDYNTLKKIASDIKKEKGIDILGSDWKIEVLPNIKKIPFRKNVDMPSGDWNKYGAKLIPINDYVGSGSWSKSELEKDHVKSPMMKVKKTVPDGLGSKKSSDKLPTFRKHQLQFTSESKLIENIIRDILIEYII